MTEKKFELGIYLIGSLRNSEIPKLARKLREVLNVEVFDMIIVSGFAISSAWEQL